MYIELQQSTAHSKHCFGPCVNCQIGYNEVSAYTHTDTRARVHTHTHRGAHAHPRARTHTHAHAITILNSLSRHSTKEQALKIFEKSKKKSKFMGIYSEHIGFL